MSKQQNKLYNNYQFPVKCWLATFFYLTRFQFKYQRIKHYDKA